MERDSPHDLGSAPIFPDLPVLRADEVEGLSAPEKYGAFYYLALVGIVALVSICVVFAYGAWRLRDVWNHIYVLHDPSRSDEARVNAALDLSRDSRVTAGQFDNFSLDERLPPLARYLVTERLTPAITAGNPRRHAATLVHESSWPSWFRLLRLRPLAYAAQEGGAIPQDYLRTLAGDLDPAIRAWALYTLAESLDENRFAAERLREMASSDTYPAPLAKLLLRALEGDRADAVVRLDEATAWVRDHHPGALEVWRDWRWEGDRLVHREDDVTPSPETPAPLPTPPAEPSSERASPPGSE